MSCKMHSDLWTNSMSSHCTQKIGKAVKKGGSVPQIGHMAKVHASRPANSKMRASSRKLTGSYKQGQTLHIMISFTPNFVKFFFIFKFFLLWSCLKWASTTCKFYSFLHPEECDLLLLNPWRSSSDWSAMAVRRKGREAWGTRSLTFLT